MKSKILALGFCFFLVSAGIAKYTSVSVPDGGTLSGKVNYSGKAAPLKKITPTSDKTVCGAHGPILSEELLVDSLRGIKNVVVTLTNITMGRPMLPTGQAVLDQQGCTFRPHVMVVPVGQKVKVVNSDGIIHNIHTYSKLNPPVNFAQPGSVKQIDLNPFVSPELIKVTCDVHGWMSAYIWVSEHPYSVVTGQDGSYEIPDIPKGKYRVEFWHETLGKIMQEVIIEKEKATKLDVTYPAKTETNRK